MTDVTELRTERLRLRAWRPEDRAPYSALNADPVVMEYFPSTLSRGRSDAQVDRIEAKLADQGWGLWAAERVDTGAFIGFIGLDVTDFWSNIVEVGWRLAREHWGQGFAPEGAREALRFAFEELHLTEVVSLTAVKNAKSRRVMEKIGLTHYPDDDFDHPNLAEDDPLRRHVLYRMFADEFKDGAAT